MTVWMGPRCRIRLQEGECAADLDIVDMYVAKWKSFKTDGGGDILIVECWGYLTTCGMHALQLLPWEKVNFTT